MRELISITEQDGFEIRFYTLPETDNPEGMFDDDGFTARQIAEGNLEWFTACVTASKAGIVLGKDYLGCCCYETAEEFLESLYYEDMIRNAIDAARGLLDILAGESTGQEMPG